MPDLLPLTLPHAATTGALPGAPTAATGLPAAARPPGQRPALLFGILGAESTGKSTLAAELAACLGPLTGLRCTWVPEYLREWCNTHQRTPNEQEQNHVAEEMARRIEMACTSHDVVLADTTPLMTAVYHHQVFGQATLDATTQRWHRRCTLTLLTALDLPWQADDLQRDGPQVREPVDSLTRELLMAAGLPFTVVSGSGAARLQSALHALGPHLRRRAASGSGLFSRLAEREAFGHSAARRWSCQFCDVPDCEQACRRLKQSDTLKV
jgi:nicotinamide riboside kinase